MSRYPALTDQENAAAYMLHDLHYAGATSTSLTYWNGGKDAYNIIQAPRHRVNYYLVEGDGGSDECRLMSAVRVPGRKPFMHKQMKCTAIEGLQVIKYLHDDYKLDCRINGRKPVVQDNAMLGSLNDRICDFKASGGVPKIVCTDKIILPPIDRTDAPAKGTDWLRDQYRPYFMRFMPDKWGRDRPFSADDRAFLDKHDELELPEQFLGCKRFGADGDYYDLMVVKPMQVQSIAHYPDYLSMAHDINLLGAAYINPAADQPDIRQLWTQNARDWNLKGGVRYAVSLDRMSKAVGHVVRPIALDNFGHTNDAAATIARQPVFTN